MPAAPNLQRMRALRGIRNGLAAVLVAAAAMPGGAVADVPSCNDGFDPIFELVGVHRCYSDALGGVTPVSYFVPASCEFSSCKSLYLLHGFGGDHTSMLGTADAPSAFVRALTTDPITGEPEDPLHLILIAPHGRTVASAGQGAPPPGTESFWVDWNPRYWAQPPRFETFVTEELVALVEGSFPAERRRSGRGIDGISLGGFGSFGLALRHPDLYASAGSISGALNILVGPGPQPLGPSGAGLGTDAIPYTPQPPIARTPPGFPFGDPFGTFGDPAADEAYYRGNNPLDLAMNAGGLPLRFFHNDTITRDPSEIANPPSYLTAHGLEAAVLPMNLEMVSALRTHGHPFTHEIHPGLHAGRYWDPYIRAQMEWHAATMAAVTWPPETFSFRSIDERFSVWGWDVEVAGRDQTEFTHLWSANTEGFTLTGSGTVTVRAPFAATSVTFERIGAGSEPTGVVTSFDPLTVRIELGPGSPVDERGGSSGAATGRGVRVRVP